MIDQTVKVIGVGSPIVDLIAGVGEDVLLSVPGRKGGMELVDSQAMESLMELVSGEPVRAPGGSAANTTFALARLGVSCAFLGKLGDDRNGAYYRDAFERLGGDCSRFKTDKTRPTATCLSFVTPDSERTLRTDLGSAMALRPEEITAEDFAGCSLAHIEGYLLFNPDLLAAVLEAAAAAGCRISLDLGSFEIVEAAREILPGLLERYVDIVFANEEEAASFCCNRNPEAGIEALGALCAVAAVKCGPGGALLKDKTGKVHTPAIEVDNVLDTTGAGDFWAAGFCYGHLSGSPLAVSGRLGSLLGGNVVQHLGADLPAEVWKSVIEEVEKTMWRPC